MLMMMMMIIIHYNVILIRLEPTFSSKIICASFEAITGAEKPCHILQQQQKGQHKEQIIVGVEKKVIHTVYESKSAKRQAQKGQLQKE